MKKILSVILAVMMIFGAVSVSVSAASEATTNQIFGGSNPLADKNTQTVLSFDFNGGKNRTSITYYDTQVGFVVAEPGKYTGVYYMIPQSKDTQFPGHFISLPQVTAPSGYVFDGWYCYKDGQTYAAVGNYIIPEYSQGSIIEFRAAFSPAEIEADTMDTIMGILSKVFGAIIGILMYGGDTAAGVAMMDKILGGVLG